MKQIELNQLKEEREDEAESFGLNFIDDNDVGEGE